MHIWCAVPCLGRGLLARYFALNPEHSPRIRAEVENGPIMRSRGGGGMLKTVERIKVRQLVYIYTVGQG